MTSSEFDVCYFKQKMFVFRKSTSLQPRALQTTLAVIILSFLSALGHFQKVTLLGAFSCPSLLIDGFSKFTFWLNNWLIRSKDADGGGKGAPYLLAPGLVLAE